MRLMSVAATTETAIAQPKAGRQGDARSVSCPMQSLDRRKCKSVPFFANADPVLFFCKNDIVTITMARVRILSIFLLFATANACQKHNNQPGGQGKQKVSVSCLFTVLCVGVRGRQDQHKRCFLFSFSFKKNISFFSFF